MSGTGVPKPQLRRALSAWAITIYAVGDILGAGIYALVGKVVGLAGGGAWISFVIAAVIALLTGLTYAEFSSRFPFAGGAAAYCRRAFASPAIAFTIGLLVLASGVTSAATVSHAFVGYLAAFVEVPPLLASVGLLALMALLNYRGIEESSRVNFLLTAVELFGLLLVIGAGMWHAAGASQQSRLVGHLAPLPGFEGVVSGVTIAFFAYIGFEDTANVAEEVKNPSRALPRAILTAIACSCLLYAGVTTVALLTVPAETLARSGAPLLEVLRAAGVELPGGAFSAIALFAIVNTGLLNLIMASRLAYGMACEGLLPAALARIQPVRQTPWLAVLLTFGLAVALAVSGGVRVLAQTTSLLLLLVFTVLHVGLVRVKRRDPATAAGIFTTPAWTPMIGAVLCGGMALQYPLEVYARTALVLAAAVALYPAFRRRTASNLG